MVLLQLETRPRPATAVSYPAWRAAREYLAQGLAVTPVQYREKKPVHAGWTELRLTEADLEREFGRGQRNVGPLLGAPSGHLVDVDLDAPEALALRGRLPHTHRIPGRLERLSSHRLYRSVVVTLSLFRSPLVPDAARMSPQRRGR